LFNRLVYLDEIILYIKDNLISLILKFISTLFSNIIEFVH